MIDGRINIDTTQLFQVFHNLNDKKIMNSDEHKSVIQLFTSSESFGKGSLGRNEISYDDLCKGLLQLPSIVRNTRQLARIWDDLGHFIYLSMLINIEKK